MSNDTAKTITTNIVPVQGIFEPLPPYKPVTLIGPAGTPFYAPTNPNLDGVSITNSTINSSVIGGVTPAAATFTNIATTTGTITSVPSGPTSLVNQAYVDAVAQGLSFKQPAAFTTTGNITLSGLGTQAGGDWPSTLTAGDRILVRNQTAQEDNGIYVAASSGWTRATDANTYDEFLSAYLFVTGGTIYSGSAWVCTNQPGGTLGVTPIVFIQFANTALYNAGTGLTLTGYTFSITNTGVTAASYGSASDTLTAVVNAQGQLTSLAASPIAIANTQVSGLGTMSTQNSTSVSITGGNIDGTTIGGTTAAAVTGTTVTANTQFSGPGTGLTGTASALSIGGNAATATSATTATNLAGGATGSLPYQSGAGATTFLAAGTNGQVLTLAGGVPTWAAEQFQGDVVGPASATNNAIARFDTTSGKLIQNSTVTLSDAGALQNVNEINWDITPTGVVGGAGSLSWNSDDNTQTLDLVGAGANVTIALGEETYYRVRASADITKGQVVMFTGTLGASGGLTAAPATGLTPATSQYVMGIAAETFTTNNWGYIAAFGEVRGFNTTGGGEAWVNGQILYLNPSVAGGLTKTVPTAPAAKVEVCAVVYANANGSVFVRPTFFPSFNQLNDVAVGSPSNGDLVVWDSGDSRWESVAQSTITAGKATNLAGGGAGQVPYQSAADTTAFVSAGTTGQVLTSNGTSAPTWTTPVAAVTVTDDTTTNSTRYPLFADATSGTLATTFVSSTKYQFNPSTGALTATSFSGAGTGLTGTASSLSIGGNAATATSATTATNLAGGANGSLPYQTGSGATTFLAAGTDGYILTQASGVPTWAAAPQTGITITDDTSTNATRYITFTDATTGTETGLDVSSTKLQFNPSTGTLGSTVVATNTVNEGTSGSGVTIDSVLLKDNKVTANELTINSNNISADNSLGFRNRIINGGFNIAQRGTSFVSGANNDDTYNLDRWYVLSDGNDAVDITQTTTVPTGAKFSIGLDVETTNKKFGIAQIIENANCFDAIGKTVTLSFDARVSSTTKLDNVKCAIVAWSGTADSVTSDIISAWNAEGTNPTLIANATYENSPANLNVTTSFARYTVSAAVDTANTTNIIVFIWSDVTDTTAGDFLYITNVQLEVGGVATPFERRPYGTELSLCQRYLPAFNSTGTASAIPGSGIGAATTFTSYNIPFMVPTRVAPTGVSISSGAHFTLDDAVTLFACDALSFSMSSVYGAQVLPTRSAGGLTQYRPYNLRFNNASGQLLFTGCEL